jgi:hypothetical protein
MVLITAHYEHSYNAVYKEFNIVRGSGFFGEKHL